MRKQTIKKAGIGSETPSRVARAIEQVLLQAQPLGGSNRRSRLIAIALQDEFGRTARLRAAPGDTSVLDQNLMGRQFVGLWSNSRLPPDRRRYTAQRSTTNLHDRPKGDLCHEGRRSRLRCRLLQIRVEEVVLPWAGV